MGLVEDTLLILAFVAHVNIKSHGRLYLITIQSLSANKTEHAFLPFFISLFILDSYYRVHLSNFGTAIVFSSCYQRNKVLKITNRLKKNLTFSYILCRSSRLQMFYKKMFYRIHLEDCFCLIIYIIHNSVNM